jgi:hypothetical protein
LNPGPLHVTSRCSSTRAIPWASPPFLTGLGPLPTHPA